MGADPFVPEAFELVQFVGHRPDEDALHARLRERHESLGEQLGWTGPRTTESATVVANVISPECSMTAASAMRPSSQGTGKTM